MISYYGAVLVGLLASVSIVTGTQMVLQGNKELTNSRGVIRLFAFGTGAFFTAVCLDFLPDAWSAAGQATPFWLFLGASVLWAISHLSDFWFRREQEKQVDEDESTTSLHPHMRMTRSSAVLLALALSFHTFLEGAAVQESFSPLTWKTLGFSLAMILHKLPEGVLWGLALTSVFPNFRRQIKRLLWFPAVFTVVGVLLGIYLTTIASSKFIQHSTALVAGAMIYIAFAELLPALRESIRPRISSFWFVVGLLIMFSLNELSQLFGG